VAFLSFLPVAMERLSSIVLSLGVPTRAGFLVHFNQRETILKQGLLSTSISIFGVSTATKMAQMSPT